jgi:regulator of protease activity HflC (stomatin/prohibitin superfamily)
MKKIKMMLLPVLAIVMMIAFTSCNKKNVEPGFIGIKVNLLGGEKGVQNELLGVGRYYIGVNEKLYIFPTYQVNYSYTKSVDEGKAVNQEFTFQTREGMECTTDIGLSFHFEKTKIISMFQKYHQGIDELEDIVVRNSIRDAINKVSSGMKMDSVYGNGKAVLITSVQKLVKQDLDSTGIVIDKLSLIGSIRLPASVKAALDSKNEMTQKAEQSKNEVLKAENDAKVKIAAANGEAQSLIISARAEAEANKLKTQTITPILIQYKIAEAWDGHLPTVTGGSVPMITLPTK